MADKPTSPNEPSVQFSVGCSPVCDVVRKPKRRKRKSRPWHRTLGMLSALPLIWVLITGLLLNHEEDIGLAGVEITSPLILSVYGMMPSGDPLSVSCGGKMITVWDGQVFLQDKALEFSGDFIGAASDANGLVLVSEHGITRLDAAGELIENLDELSLPTLPLLAVGKESGEIFVQNHEGWNKPDADWLAFQLEAAASPHQSELKPLEDELLMKSISKSWSGGGISLSRVVLDLHSGNFFGAGAKYFYDFVVLCTLWLIGTGVVLQYRTSRRGKSTR